MIKPGTPCIVRTDPDTDAAPYNGLIVTVVSGPRMATRQRPPFDEVPVYEIAPPISPELRYAAARVLFPIEPPQLAIEFHVTRINRDALWRAFDSFTERIRRDINENVRGYPRWIPPKLPPKR